MRQGYGRAYHGEGPGFGLGTSIPPGVRLLLIVNALAFLVFNVLFAPYQGVLFGDWLGLSSHGVLHGRIWQLGTYLFLHGDFLHFLFNMFYLFMFGSAVERAWGRDRFLSYYFVTGAGAALVWTLVKWGSLDPTVGASGSVYAVLLAFGLLFPNATVLLFFMLPIRVKYLVAILIGAEVLYLVSNAADGVNHLIHLAGVAIGFLVIRQGFSVFPIIDRYRRWRMRRRLTVIDYRELMKFDEDDHDQRPGGRGSSR